MASPGTEATLTKYGHCPKRSAPNCDLNEELVKEIGASARVLPLYESGMFDSVRKKHYSLNNNEHLVCRWQEFKDGFPTRVVVPFQFPDRRDIHFYNGALRLMPSKSEYKRTNFRKSLRPGPGVDYGGQIPIPQDMLMKTPLPDKHDKEKNKKLSKKVEVAKK